MDAENFIKTRRRMCGEYLGDGKCLKCPVIKTGGCDLERCEEEDLDKIVAAVEKWASEHPAKTRQSEFLERWTMPCLRAVHITAAPQNLIIRRFVTNA